jgi:hypothetical protein
MITDPVGSALDVSMLAGGGAGLATRAPTLAQGLAKVSELTNPINLTAKPLGWLMQPGPLSQTAKLLGTSKTSLSKVSQSIGDIPQARATADMLGPEAMAAHLSPQATQDARLLASMNLKNGASATLASKVQEVLDNSGTRASRDWQAAVGPTKSRFDKTLEVARTKAGTSSMYDIAKGRVIDPKAIVDEIPKLVDTVKNNPDSRAAISELNDMLVNPRTGGFVTDAGERINARQRIDELIKKAGTSQTVTPGADLYEIGRRTTTGGHLSRLRKVINDTLHQDPMLAQADATFSGAERARSAFELGNKRIIGTGDSVMEPQALAAKFAKMKPEEQASLLEGLSRKGNNAIGDVKPNRNDGKAMADAFATPNNLERFKALGINSDIVRNMAAREDALASSSNRILGGSDTARTDLAKNQYTPPGAPVHGGNSFLAAMLGLSGYTAWAHPLLGATLAGGSFGVKKLAQIIANSNRNRIGSASAELLSRQGPAVKALLEAIESSKIKKRRAPVNDKALIRALIAGQVNQGLSQ